MLLLDLSNCGSADLLKVIYFLKLLINIVFVILPIALIVYLMIDFAKMAASNNSDEQKKMVKLTVKRMVSVLLVFFVPFFVEIFNTVLGDLGVDYSVCYNNITMDEIEYIDSIEFKNEQAEKYVRNAERTLTEEAFKKAEEYIKGVEDEDIKKRLQERLEDAKKYAEENPKADVEVKYDSYSTSGKCSYGFPHIALTSEPDPSCANNLWLSIVGEDHIYPKVNGKRLGSWPTNYEEIPTVVKITKKYEDGKLIWPLTPVKELYSFVYQHNGIDIMAVFESPIYAPASGTLMYSEWGHTGNTGSDETAYSVSILMDKPIVKNGVKYDTIFLTHMSGIINRCSSVSSCNKKVVQGELLGFSGNAAGTATTGGWAPHLHMSIYPASSYNDGLNSTTIQELYGISCGTSCKDLSIKAGG